jgi:hypothetical protein
MFRVFIFLTEANNIRMQANIYNEHINWIEEAISNQLIKYFEYKHFNNVQVIGT